MNGIAQFFDWLSHVHLYPYYEAMNIVSVVAVGIMVFVGFIHLRPKLGILKGAIISIFCAFTTTSIMDIVKIVLNIDGLLTVGWTPASFLSRWVWKFFLLYWTVKLLKKYKLTGKVIVIRPLTFILIGLYYFFFFFIDYMLFSTYGFRSSILTSHPRWFVFATEHVFGYTFSTLIYTSVWRFDMPDEPFLKEQGMGEVYMLYALQKLFHKLQIKHKIRSIVEVSSVVKAEDFPDRDWSWEESVCDITKYDLVYTYNGYPHRIARMKEFMQNGGLIMWSATLPKSIGYYLQKAIGDDEDKYYGSRKDLIKQAEDAGITVIDSGYFDAPFWPDHSKNVIAPTRQLGIDMGLVKQLTILERFKTRFNSHHAWVLGVYER